MFEINPETNQIRCTVCSAVDQARAKWIARKGAKRHLDSVEHAENIKASLRRQEAIAAQQRQLEESYSSLRPATINSSIPNTVPSTRANIFDDLPDLIVCNDDDMFLPLNCPIILAGVDPLLDGFENEQERLQRAVDLLIMQAEHDDELGLGDADDDATVTNIADNLNSLGM